MTTLIVIAKEPVAGRVKTRLSPPFTLEQAALLASAAIDDTLATLGGLAVDRRILLYDGERLPDSADGYEVMPQSTGDLDDRLADAFDACSGRTVLVGMDTPQVTVDDLAPAFAEESTADAWFGPATDGGFWALGMREPRGELIRGVPMSRSDTGVRQLARLTEAGSRVEMLTRLTDVDTVADAFEVATAAPHTGFARCFERLLPSANATAETVTAASPAWKSSRLRR